MNSAPPKRVYVIAGETSGDLHGANLIRHLQTHAKEPLRIYGIGGDRIHATGAWGFFDLAHIQVTGLSEALKKIPQYRRASRHILTKIKNIRPELVVLIDNPGFNLHLAERIHAMGIPIVYYIAPQLWAWAPQRIRKIKKYISKVLVVFEFEKKIYEDAGIPVEFVGHPLKDVMQAAGDVRELKQGIGIGHDGHLVTLMPGSRKGELKLLCRIFLETARTLSGGLPRSYFALIKAPAIPREFYTRMFAQFPDLKIDLVEKNAYEVIRASDLVLVCSGTATLECALLGTPMIIANRGTLLTYVAAKSLIRVPYLGLPNLILGQMRFPELLQYDCTPVKLAGASIKVLTDAKVRQRMKQDLKEVSQRLGPEGATRRAALAVLKMLSEAKEQAGTFQVRS